MEKSCDESVIRQMGSGIKKEYSISHLSLSTGRRFIGGSPLAFGESNTKGRIKNILNYKKPAFWVVLVAIFVVAALCVGLISNPKNESLTVKDYTEQFMDQNITSYENRTDIKIINSPITRLEKKASLDDILATPLEIWSLEYRLKPDDQTKADDDGKYGRWFYHRRRKHRKTDTYFFHYEFNTTIFGRNQEWRE